MGARIQHFSPHHHFRSSLKGPLRLLAVALLAMVGLQFAPTPIRTHLAAAHGPKLLLLIAALWTVDRLLSMLFRSHFIGGTFTDATRSLSLLIARILFYCLGLLIVLDNFGISITPVLASLGVSSLAVALALQDTLVNFFSGVYMLVDKPVRPGDTIQIDAFQGKVLRIGWRSTHVQLGTGSTLVIPNSKLASSLITNFDLPDAECSVNCEFTLAHQTALQIAEAAIQRAIERTASACAASLTDAAPVLRFQSITELGIAANVAFKVRQISEQGLLKHVFIKNLREELSAAKIDFAEKNRVRAAD